MSMSSGLVDRYLDYVDYVWATFEAWIFEDKRALWGASLARILSGTSAIGILVTNFRVRDILFGQGSVWNKPLQDISGFAPARLVAHMGSTVFLLYYLAVIVVAALFVLGWHTRFVGPLLVVGMISIIERIPILGDQGDNILRVGLILLMFMHTNEHWSLDARRRARTTAAPVRLDEGGVDLLAVPRNLWNSHYLLPRWFSNAVHNIFLIALGLQVMLVYLIAGLWKVGGQLWQHGTALYYPLQLQEFRPFPFLTDIFTQVGLVVGVATYLAVFLQLAFSFALLHPIARRIAIFFAIMFHLSIAVLMALPWFSLSMIAFDAIFVSTSTFVALDGWLRGRLRAVRELVGNVAGTVGGRPQQVRGRHS